MKQLLFFQRTMRAGVLVIAGCCLAAVCVLAGTPGTAHALFTMDVHTETSHGVTAFPAALAVESGGAEIRSSQIDRGNLQVSVVNSDGTSHVLDEDDYELVPATIPAGFKGDFATDVVYQDGDRRLSQSVTLTVNGAYGAQYGDILVFGRGIPAVSYEGKELSSTTWGIEEAGCAPQWNKDALASIVDIDTVRPASMHGWFFRTSSLETVELDQIDITGCETLIALFEECTGLTSLKGVENWDTSHITDISWFVCGCTALTSVDVASWDTSSLINMRAPFSRTGLTSIDLSRWNTSNVRDADLIFWNSPALTTVGDLSNWDTSNLEDIAGAFAYLAKVKTVGDIGKWDMSHVSAIDHLFQGCLELTYCGDLSHWDTSQFTDLKYMFHRCRALTSIGDISRWNTSNVTGMYGTFLECVSLQANCSSWDVSKVTDHLGFNGYDANAVIPPAWKQ